MVASQMGDPPAGVSEIERRKDDHIDIVLRQNLQNRSVTSGFEAVRFAHCALPELHLDDVEIGTTFLGRALRAPFLISSMTGGPARAGAVNRHLAEAAQALGIALAVGSQRVALESAADAGFGRALRRAAPSVPLLANLGGAQLVAGYGAQEALRVVDMIEADALIIHLNPLQEAVQPEGDRDWRGVLAAIGRLAAALPVPLVAKEVGAGLSAAVARQLVEAGVQVIDVAGAGGTSWAAVEAARATDAADRAVAEAFVDWGIPTARCVAEARSACPEATLVASGGIRDGVDAAKAIRLGADLVGQAGPVLESALLSAEAVTAHFEVLIRQLRIACFCTGSPNLAALRRAPLVSPGPPA